VNPNDVVLVIDNYDSFTYNLVQYLGELGEQVVVHRNNEITLSEITDLRPVAAVLSPGPGTPGDAGICKDLLLELGPTLPTLGVCLGHQCLGEAYGGQVRRAAQVMHGKVSRVLHREQSVFHGLPSPFVATRYHSLVVESDDLPADLEVTAWTEDGTVMGLRHRHHPLAGVQFHPEAILTEHGHQLLTNFLQDARAWWNTRATRSDGGE
jgi:anthranilate synthase/aminodeoxychorismate synthase-like glutamine amidotransferase